jgi:hypothetical protein
MRLMFAVALLLLPSAMAIAGGDPDLDPATICASNYQPVCASKADTARTFPNACLAKRAGFTPISQGACGGASSLPRFCTRQYAPVCGERDGVRREFGNACEARAEDFAVVREGAC